RQEVQTLMRFLLPPGRVTARTVWMFGSHRRLVRRWECDTDLPKRGPFPQISHTAAICELLEVKYVDPGSPPQPAVRPDNLARIPATGENTKIAHHAGAPAGAGAVSENR